MGRWRDILILTNNPLVVRCMADEASFSIRYLERADYRAVLIAARDLIHAGHRLYTHPLAGSVKPFETPYRSVAVSLRKRDVDFQEVMLISDAIEACDKFQRKTWSDNNSVLKDFQLIDYDLLANAIGFKVHAGLEKADGENETRGVAALDGEQEEEGEKGGALL